MQTRITVCAGSPPGTVLAPAGCLPGLLLLAAGALASITPEQAVTEPAVMLYCCP